MADKLKDKATLSVLVPPKLRLLSATRFMKEVQYPSVWIHLP